MENFSYKTMNNQNIYIPYENLEKRLKSIPQEFFLDVSNFFDLLEYKIDFVKAEKEKEKKLSAQDGLDLLEQITGCVSENISMEDAKSDYFAEKYGIEK